MWTQCEGDSNFRIFSLHFWARCGDNGDGGGDGHQQNTASSCSQLQTIHTDLHSGGTMGDTRAVNEPSRSFTVPRESPYLGKGSVKIFAKQTACRF